MPNPYTERDKQYARERRQTRKAHGICTLCGYADARPGKTTCQPCADKLKWYEQQERMECREQHRCVACRKPLPEDWKKWTCPDCLHKAKLRRTRKKEEENGATH